MGAALVLMVAGDAEEIAIVFEFEHAGRTDQTTSRVDTNRERSPLWHALHQKLRGAQNRTQIVVEIMGDHSRSDLALENRQQDFVVRFDMSRWRYSGL